MIKVQVQVYRKTEMQSFKLTQRFLCLLYAILYISLLVLRNL